MQQSPRIPGRAEPGQEILRIALEQFSVVGYAGASLQQIADGAGYSKSSVLYHFASKEALLEAAITPALDRLDVLLSDSVGRVSSPDRREEFVEEFIDFLLQFRLQSHIIINQGLPLADIPIIARARASIDCLADSFMADLPSVADRVRLGVALGGAAYILAAMPVVDDDLDPAETRDALIAVVSELVAPLSESVPAAGASTD